MMMKQPTRRHILLGVHVTDRLIHADQVQKLLTQYGHLIKTRLGLHETSDPGCAPNGLLLLELLDHDDEKNELARKLSAITGVEVKEMVFDHAVS